MPTVVVDAKEPPVPATATDTIFPGKLSEKTVAPTHGIVQGFRIQLLTTGNRAEADSLADEFQKRLGQKVYHIYDPPLFKLRVGDFADETEAGEALDKIKKEGFPDAWIVRDKVEIK
ncbi:MAG: SPOR domain-containing protein [Thermoproteales archaeon]|nr:SPOR domain-containing protein [Thermoproteales archaeon]